MVSKIEKQQEVVNTLLSLVKENPDLKIIPMVETEVVGDDSYSAWAGNWGKAEIDEYYNADERIYFKSLDYDELVEDALTDDEYAELEFEEALKMAEQKVNDFLWIKAIIVNITTA